MLSTPRILVLAGRRSAVPDPLAEQFAVSHKCLVPVRGEAMISRVLGIVDAAFPEAKIFVSIENFALIRGEPIVVRLMGEGRLTPVDAQDHIVDSIVHAAKTTGFPLIVTTADNVLMTPDALHRLAEAGRTGGADSIVVMARKDAIRATHPDGQRRFYEFKDDGYSNCNMFWLGNARALQATEAFRHGGQFAKKPERIIKAFGILNLIRFRFRLEPLEGIFRHVSRRFRVDIRPLVLEDGRLAIDVDNERTHRVAEEVLAREEAPETNA
jgi:GTP:adenosylcobinamide-phosphate guanylyltransferase